MILKSDFFVISKTALCTKSLCNKYRCHRDLQIDLKHKHLSEWFMFNKYKDR
jgi:hypothetical protein